MPTSSPGSHPKTYDLYLRSGGRRLSFAAADHGVTLTDDGLHWVEGDEECSALFRDIAEVHLQTGSIGPNTIASCRLRLGDGATVLISSNNERGLEDEGRDRLYADFVHDLHARLAARKDTGIAFTAGFGDTRYRFGQVILVIAGLFFLVTPTVLLFMTRSWSMAWTLYIGVGLVWPLYRLVMANAPRSYDPREVPKELLPTPSTLG